jgi:RNA polymerase sigma-70 factor
MQGVPEAIPTIERFYIRKLKAWTLPERPAQEVDDALQAVRVHLLVGTTPDGPMLAAYRGQASLKSWVRVIAVNILLEKRAASVRQGPEEEPLTDLESLPAVFDAEQELIKHRFRQEFQQALNQAAVSGGQRILLKLYFIDRLTTTEIGRLYGKDQSTVSRMLRDIRGLVYKETKRLLEERLLLSSSEFSEVWDILREDADLDLSQLLDDENEAG